MVLNHVEPSCYCRKPCNPVDPSISARPDGGGRGWRRPLPALCPAFTSWHVKHVRTCSVTSISRPTQKARQKTSEPVLVRQKCPPSSSSCHSRSTCVRGRTRRDAQQAHLALAATVQQVQKQARGSYCQTGPAESALQWSPSRPAPTLKGTQAHWCTGRHCPHPWASRKGLKGLCTPPEWGRDRPEAKPTPCE